MQYITNKIQFKFATTEGKADAYSPFAQVLYLLMISTLMILKIREVDCSLIEGEFLAVKLNIFWLLVLLSIFLLLLIMFKLKHYS